MAFSPSTWFGRLPTNDRDFVNFLSINAKQRRELQQAYRKRLREAVLARPQMLSQACTDGNALLVQMIVTDGRVNVNKGVAGSNFMDRLDITTEGARQTTSSLRFFRQDMAIVGITSFPRDLLDETLGQVDLDIDDDNIANEFYRASFPSSRPIPCSMMLFFPIHVAVVLGHLDVTKVLVENGARVDAPWYLCSSNLSQSVQTFRRDRLVSLHREDVGEYSTEPEILHTALYLAIHRGHIEVAEFLLHAGASTNLCLHPTLQVTPAHIAVAVKGKTMTQFCIDHGIFDAHQVNYVGLPPIWIAYLNMNWEVFDILQSMGANIDHDLANGFTPLTHATLVNWPTVATRLLEAGANKHVQFLTAPEIYWGGTDLSSMDYQGVIGLTPLQIYFKLQAVSPFPAIVCYKHRNALYSFLRYLGNNGLLNLDANTTPGMTMVTSLFKRRTTRYAGVLEEEVGHMISISKWRAEVLSVLVEFGANRLCSDLCGNTLVELCLWECDFLSCNAICKRSSDAVEFLKKHWSLDVFMSSFKKMDWYFSLHALELLLNTGITDRTQLVQHPLFRSRLHWAEGRLILFLISEVCPALEILSAPYGGETLLNRAISRGDLKLVERLLQAGVDLNMVDPLDPGNLPVMNAIRSLDRTWLPHHYGNRRRVLRMVVENGARVHIEELRIIE